MPDSKRSNEIGHKWLIYLMKAFGYHLEVRGLCFGISYMAMQAILTGDLATFNKRIAFLKLLSENPQKIQELRHQQLNKKMTPDLIDIIAFFDGVELYQQPQFYPYLFSDAEKPFGQNARLTMPLVSPTFASKDSKSEKEPAITQIGKTFSGVYTDDKLMMYFKELVKRIDDECGPISLILFAGSHAITIGYDTKEEQWSFINVHELPAKHFDSIDQLVANIMAIFPHSKKEEEEVGFSTKIYGRTQNKEHLGKQMNAWKTEEWKNYYSYSGFTDLHEVTPEAAAFRDAKGSSLLFLAAQQGETALVNELLEKKANVNAKTILGCSPLLMAAGQGYLEIVVALLKRKKIDLISKDYKGDTPLSIAMKAGHKEIVLLLQSAQKPLEPNVRNLTLQSILSASTINTEDIHKFQMVDGFCVNLYKIVNQYQSSKNNTITGFVREVEEVIKNAYHQLKTHDANSIINEIKKNINDISEKIPQSSYWILSYFSENNHFKSDISNLLKQAEIKPNKAHNIKGEISNQPGF